MPRLKKPSLKQKRWAENYLKHGDGKKAALESYPGITENTAGTLAYRNKNNPLVKSYIAKILDKQGLTDEKIAQKLNTIVEAGTSEKALKGARVKDALSALEMSARLKDLNPAPKIKTEATKLNLNLEGKSEEELYEMLSSLAGEIHTFQKMVKDTAVDAEVIEENETVDN